jgi:hypothetical protein
MKDANRKDAHRILLEEGHLIDEALRLGVRDALLRHKERGQPVVIMRDGKIQWVPAEELLEAEPTRVAERPDSPYGEEE